MGCTDLVDVHQVEIEVVDAEEVELADIGGEDLPVFEVDEGHDRVDYLFVEAQTVLFHLDDECVDVLHQPLQEVVVGAHWLGWRPVYLRVGVHLLVDLGLDDLTGF